PADPAVAPAGLDDGFLADVQPGAVGGGDGAGQAVGVVTLATTNVQNGAGGFCPQQLVDPVADRLVVAAVEEGLTVRQHGRGIAGLAHRQAFLDGGYYQPV